MRLRSHLIFLVVGTVLPLFLLALVLGYSLFEHQVDTLSRGTIDRNRAFMSAVDTEVRGHLTTLQVMATSINLERENLRAFYQEATRALASQPDWNNVILASTDGRQLLNTAMPFGAPLPQTADPASVQRVVATGKSDIGNVTLGRVRQAYAVSLRVPVLRGGVVRYVLIARLKLDTFQRLLRDQQLSPAWISGLVDSSGNFIARVPPLSPGRTASKDFMAALATGNEGWYRGLTVERKDTFTAFKTSTFTGWSVGLAIPAEEIYAVPFRIVRYLFVGAIATLVLTLGFAFWMGRRIAGPIVSLAEATRALGAGDDAPANAARETTISEIRKVALALDDASHAVHERQALLEREKAALHAADHAKNEFLAMLGHELRNPLAAISTSAAVMRAARAGSDAAWSARDVIERQTKHMTRLIEDLLDVSRLTMGKVALHRDVVDLAELVRRIVTTWEQSKRIRRARVIVDAEGVCVYGDHARLEQVLSNLLDNADKFSFADKPIRVSVRPHDGNAVITVADEGEGMPPDMLARAFDIFVQAPANLARPRGGMGLGLALVKRLVELHNGSVSASSPGVGRGTTITVQLPAVDAPARATEHVAAPAPEASTPRRILIVEDNDDARDTMLAWVMLEGQDARAAPDGNEALRVLQSWRPDIMLIDIGLPDIDGYELARQIRRDHIDPPKLVAVTGYGQSEDQRHAYEAGFDAHLTKPVNTETLRALIATTAIDATRRQSDAG